MARTPWKKPDKVVRIQPINAPDLDYGMRLAGLYIKGFPFLPLLFARGVSGLCLGRDEPVSTKELLDTMSSGMFSRPDDQGRKGSMPLLSSERHIHASFDAPEIKSYRHYAKLRLQADFLAILEDDEDEGTGAMAVAVAHALASVGFVPSGKRDAFSLLHARIAMAFPDKDHEEEWIGVEFDICAHPLTRIPLGLPRGADGLLDIESLEKIAGNQAGETDA